jgi:hypothetical protein
MNLQMFSKIASFLAMTGIAGIRHCEAPRSNLTAMCMLGKIASFLAMTIGLSIHN